MTVFLEEVKKVAAEGDMVLQIGLQLVMDHQNNKRLVMDRQSNSLLVMVPRMHPVRAMDHKIIQSLGMGLLVKDLDLQVRSQDLHAHHQGLDHHLDPKDHVDHKVQDPKLQSSQVMEVHNPLKQVMDGPKVDHKFLINQIMV